MWLFDFFTILCKCASATTWDWNRDDREEMIIGVEWYWKDPTEWLSLFKMIPSLWSVLQLHVSLFDRAWVCMFYTVQQESSLAQADAATCFWCEGMVSFSLLLLPLLSVTLISVWINVCGTSKKMLMDIKTILKHWCISTFCCLHSGQRAWNSMKQKMVE